MSDQDRPDVRVNGTERTAINANQTVTPGEPAEDDPCMGESKKKPRDYLTNYRDSICKKTGLTHEGFYYVGGLIVFCVILLIIVITLGASWPRTPHAYQFPICSDSACLRAAAQVHESLNTSYTPCENLWEWSCGGWLQKNPLPKTRAVWNRKEQLVKEETERVRDMIATFKLPLHTGTVEWKLKRLYEACLDVDNARNTDQARPLTNIISELGGWYILRDWNFEDFDSNFILTELHVRYGVTPFFKITVEPNPNFPGQNSIRISPSGLGLPNREYYYREDDDRIQIAYKELIRDIVLYLNTAGSEATKFGNDIFSYEKRIAEITPELTTLQNPLTTYNPISISELKETILIPFYDILTKMYPEANISEQTEVIVSSSEYLTAISQIMATTDRKTMNGYLIWTLVRNYVPFLSEKYVLAIDSFKTELFGIQKSQENWEVCSNLVQRFMSLATDVLIEKNEPLDQNITTVVTDVFKSILNTIKDQIISLKNVPNLYKQIKDKLSTIQVHIGVPKQAKDETYIKTYYSKLKIIKNNLFENVKNGIFFQKKLEEKRLMQSQSDATNLFEYALAEVPKVVYSPFDNAVIIPRSLLSQSYIESKYPSSIIFGRLGVEISSAILSAILPYGSFWTSNRKILSPFHMTVNESIDSVRNSQNCLRNYILNLNLDVPYAIANETALNALKHVTAVKITNQALLEHLKREQHVHQPSLENYDDSALFFLSYAQTQCTESTSQLQLYKKLLQFELPERSMLHLLWSQLPEFSTIFECNFNRKSKCSDIF